MYDNQFEQLEQAYRKAASNIREIPIEFEDDFNNSRRSSVSRSSIRDKDDYSSRRSSFSRSSSTPPLSSSSWESSSYCTNCHGFHHLNTKGESSSSSFISRGESSDSRSRARRSASPYNDYIKKTEVIGLSTCPRESMVRIKVYLNNI